MEDQFLPGHRHSNSRNMKPTCDCSRSEEDRSFIHEVRTAHNTHCQIGAISDTPSPDFATSSI